MNQWREKIMKNSTRLDGSGRGSDYSKELHRRRMAMRKGWLQAVLRRAGLGLRKDVRVWHGHTAPHPRRSATAPTTRMRRQAHRMGVA